MIKLGQIGIGHNHGASKMLAARKFPELFEIVGYAEESEEWVAKRGTLPAYEGLPRLSVEEVLARSDAILVETEVQELTKTAQLCVDAGKHIHMDKPASGTLEEFKHLLDTAREKNLVVQMGYMYRYNPAVQKCLALIDEGKLGQISFINAEMSAYDPPEYKKWLSQFPGAGMYIFGSHLLDLVIRILGEPEKITSFAKHTGLDGVDLPDLTCAILEYPKALARITNSSVEVNGYGRRQFVVCGSKGTVNIVPIERPTRMMYSDLEMGACWHNDVQTQLEVENLPASDRYREMMECFHGYITGEKQNIYTYEHDFMVQKVLSQIVGGIQLHSKHIDER